MTITRTWKIFGAPGHRQKESFYPSVKYDWSDKNFGTRIVEIKNSDKTGTNDYSLV